MASPAGGFAPVLVCLLGSFRVVKFGQTVSLKSGGKAESLLANLALSAHLGLSRDQILTLLWPASDPTLASQSLNTLVYSLHRALGDALSGRPPADPGDAEKHERESREDRGDGQN